MLKLLNFGRGRKYVLLLFDIVCILLSNTFVYFVLKALDEKTTYLYKDFVTNTLIMLGFVVILRVVFGVYGYVWRYPTTFAYLRLSAADLLAGGLSLIVSLTVNTYKTVWHFTDGILLSLVICLISRFSYRLFYKYVHNISKRNKNPHINVAIVGAGQLGAFLANDLLSNRNQIYSPKFFFDIDNAKVGGKVSGLPVYKKDELSSKLIKDSEISEIIIAIKNLENDKADEIYKEYCLTGCKVKIYDSPIQNGAGDGENTQRVIREFGIEDLLFRKPHKLSDAKILKYYLGKTVLVTGGGGSIGSELCRQIAKCNPGKLIIFDIYENNAYEIQQELIRKYGVVLDLYVEIGSVRDRERLEEIFSKYKPDVVFHAAAHKHVPLMEDCPAEAIKNNVFGTYNTADMAEKYSCEKFILISTDKAVNPTNIMGASKRLCEMAVQCRTGGKTSFACVRFGNVLGSNGSVIPLFKRQIAQGGPITLTDKRIIRYFMTIPEASQLVIKSGALAKSGELFVLDMGKPVRILDLAINMIRLSGFEPDKDIKIEEIGLRPGEKLYEELLVSSEDLSKTEDDLIFIEKDTPLTRNAFDKIIAKLKSVIGEEPFDTRNERISRAVAEFVPTFHKPEEVNSTAEVSKEMKSVLVTVNS